MSGDMGGIYRSFENNRSYVARPHGKTGGRAEVRLVENGKLLTLDDYGVDEPGAWLFVTENWFT